MKLKLFLCVVLFFGAAMLVHCDEDAAPAATTTEAAPAAVKPEDAFAADGFNSEDISKLSDSKEQYEFQAEVNRLMDIIINSLYSNREVFLRELISNASDALDKIRYLSLTDKAQLGEGDAQNLDIRIKLDKQNKVLIIQDKGVGMTKKDLVQNLGTVASSGTTKFVEAAGKGGSDALSLIGQFGVGFYSVYLVADTVTVVTKNNEDKQYVWHSAANRTFTISEDPRGNTLGRGTQIILHLKDDAKEFLEQYSLERLITKYSEFINFPILLEVTRTEEKEVPVEEEKKEETTTEEKKDEEKKDDDVEVTDEEADKKDDKPKTKKVKEEVREWKQVNENKAIWTRNPKDVSEKEYEDFYKALTKDSSTILTFTHFKAEGEIAFKSILFVPETPANDLYDKYYSKSNALKLYVRRVLISDEFEDFMPRYLSFIKGVVDSDDLPLNVSRETLSKSKVLKVIGKKLTRKALDMIRKLADDADKYEQQEEEDKKKEKKEESEKTEEEKAQEEEQNKKKEELKKNAEKWNKFYKSYSKSIKLGLIEDSANKNKLQKLLRFPTSKSETPVSLERYISNMKDKQSSIYYITGESLAAVRASPFLEKLVKRDVEVVFMVDPLDEYLMSNMPDYDGKKFVSITKEGFKLDDESDSEKNLEKAMEKYYEDFTKYLKKVYGDKVEKVTISSRITDSPAVLVTSQYGWSANMERIMKAQTFGDASRQAYMIAKRTMELNPRHPMIKELKLKSEQSPDDDQVKDLATLLYDSALLSSGFTIDDATTLSKRLNRVIAAGLNVAPDAALVSDDEFPVEAAKEAEPTSTESSDAKQDEVDSSEATSHDDL